MLCSSKSHQLHVVPSWAFIVSSLDFMPSVTPILFLYYQRPFAPGPYHVFLVHNCKLDCMHFFIGKVPRYLWTLKLYL